MKKIIYKTILFLVLGTTFAWANDCHSLLSEYSRYDSLRNGLEVRGIDDNSALRSDLDLSRISIIMQRQAMVLDIIIAHQCDLPEPPKEFNHMGVVCSQMPKAWC